MLKIHIIVLAIFIFLFELFCSIAQAERASTIKIALLDTPYIQMSPTLFLNDDHKKAYFAGVETAASVAKKYNINIQYKPFIYGHDSLDVIKEVPKIMAWNADLVIGPASSDQFTMLKNYLNDVMVISSYASGQSLKTLPSNFHSTFLPDDQLMKILAEYIHKNYPKKNIFIITQIDSKQCIDVSNIFSKNYIQLSPKTKIVEKKLFLDNPDIIDSKKLMLGHENDITIIFNFTFSGYNSLVKHITDSFPNKKLIFFSDQDNWDNAIYSTISKSDLAYESYRIGPILNTQSSDMFKEFQQAFYKIYHTHPVDSVSYLTYVSIISTVEALHKFPSSSLNMRQKILNSYSKALKKNPNWYQVNDYGIYRETTQGEVLISRLPNLKITD